MYRVLVSDKLSPQGLEILRSAPDLEVDEAVGLNRPSSPRRSRRTTG